MLNFTHFTVDKDVRSFCSCCVSDHILQTLRFNIRAPAHNKDFSSLQDQDATDASLQAPEAVLYGCGLNHPGPKENLYPLSLVGLRGRKSHKGWGRKNGKTGLNYFEAIYNFCSAWFFVPRGLQLPTQSKMKKHWVALDQVRINKPQRQIRISNFGSHRGKGNNIFYFTFTHCRMPGCASL